MTSETTPAPSAHFDLLRLPRVSARTGLSHAELYRRISMGTFTTPIKISEIASVGRLVQIGCLMVQRLAEKPGGLAYGA